MIEKIFYTLSVIYKNRYRQLTYKDASAFYIPLLAYFFAIYKIYVGTFPSFPQLDFTSYVLIIFCFSFCIYINNRKDVDLLHLLYGKNWTYFIIFLDVLLLNLINIVVCLKTNQNNVLYITLGTISFFTFYKNKVNSPLFKSFLQPINALLKTQLRRYKFIYILIFVFYYLAYQGVIIENKNLYIIATVGLIYTLFKAVTKNEKIEYFIFSNYNQKQYILKNEFAFIIDCYKLLSPILILSLIYQQSYSANLLVSILIIPSLFPLKYIYYNKIISLALSSIIIISYLIIILLKEFLDYWLIASFIPLSYILHQIAFKKFTKNIIKENTNFYL